MENKMAVTSTALYNKEEFTNRLGKRTQHKILYAVGYLCKICKRDSCIPFLYKEPRNLSELQVPQNLDPSCNRGFKETVKSALGTLKKKIVQNSSGSSLHEVLPEYKRWLER